MHHRLAICALILFSCAAPVRKHQALPEESRGTAENKSQSTANQTTAANPDNDQQFIPVADWVSRQFFVLKKQELIRNTGYNLFSCIGNRCDSLPVDATMELPNRRIRCDQIENDTLTVTNVAPDSGEWVITFTHRKNGQLFYGKTHDQAIIELAPVNDLKNAEKRWLDKIIFSRKGTLLTRKESGPASLSSIRVNILDSLLVTDIGWGTTPLPVKPLWITVKILSTGKTGFIPIRYSWTNTPSLQKTEKHPWEEDIFESDPRSLYTWDDYIWEVINNHHVILEMTPEQVELSWGAPKDISTNLLSSESMAYTYPSHILIFEHGKLARIDPVE